MSISEPCLEHAPSVQPSAESGYDVALLRRYFKDGDREAMNEMFHRNADAIYRVACGYLGNSADAEDMVQTTFLQVLEKGARIGESAHPNLRGWMMSIVIGNCRKKLRDERRHPQSFALNIERAALRSDEQFELVSAALQSVQGLPERYRLPVWLHFLEGYTFREVAHALELPESTVRVQANRGIEQIRQSLAAAGFSASVAIPALLAAPALPPVPAALSASLKGLQTSAAVKGAVSGAAKLRLGALAAIALAGMASVTAVVRLADGRNETKGDGDPPVVRAPNLEDGDAEDQRHFEQVLAADKAARAERIENARKLRELNSALRKQEDTALALSSTTVIIDEDTLEVSEPDSIESALGMKSPVRDAYEISPADFKIEQHERWSINLSDFKFDRPQYITAQDRVGREKTWIGFSFDITNPTTKARRIVPMFTAQPGFERTEGGEYWSNEPSLQNFVPKGAANVAIGAFLPEHIIAGSVFRPLNGSAGLEKNTVPLENLLDMGQTSLNPVTNMATFAGLSQNWGATFEPGQRRFGAVLWSDFSNEFTLLKIVIHGLTNSHRYPQPDIAKGFGTLKEEPAAGEKMRRVLVLTFSRKSDEFNVHRSELKFVDKRWEYLWMWDHDIAIPLPVSATEPQIKSLTLSTPAGGQKLAWAFPFELTNSTRYREEIAFNKVSFVCPIEVSIGGAAHQIEAKIVDDGESTIYKAQLLKAIGPGSPRDRWANSTAENRQTRAERRNLRLEPGRKLETMWAVFDSSDVDFDDARLQIESAARRKLTEEEFTSVKDQIVAALPAAIESAKKRKTVVAYFDCSSGLSTGTYRISRSYRLPGIVDDKALSAWEE